MWNDGLVRPLQWVFAEEATLEDIDVLRFTLAPTEMAANPVYFQSKGLFNVSAVKPADVVVSLPRFATVDGGALGVTVSPVSGFFNQV